MTRVDKPSSERTLILAPSGRDAVLASELIAAQGLAVEICASLPEVCERMPEAGAALATEESLSLHFDHLARALRDQPPWSDFPLVVFRASPTDHASRLLEMLEYLGNVTLLDRPVRKLNLVTSMLAALRARRRQYQLRDLLQELENNVRQRDQFLAMLGHELRNPLAAITTAIDLCRRRQPTLLTNELSIIHRQSRHLARLVDDLLDVSRVTSGKIVLDRLPVDLGELAERCVQALSPSARAQRLDITVDVDPGVCVEGDAVRLEQVLTNLLTNAIKYTPSGGGIAVEVRRERTTAVVAIRDTGAGISREMLPKIFNLFAQAEDTLDRARGGMGIGLTLVQSLVALHGGTVSAASDGIGCGSEFRIMLPALRDSEARSASRPEEPIGDPERKRIALVEDNADLRESLRQFLEEEGHEVRTAEDGPEGLALILGELPEIALIDIGLPRLDGYQIAESVRSTLGSKITLVALTGYGQAEDRERATRAGFDGHITKPVTGRALRRFLSQPRSSAGAR